MQIQIRTRSQILFQFSTILCLINVNETTSEIIVQFFLFLRVLTNKIMTRKVIVLTEFSPECSFVYIKVVDYICKIIFSYVR